MMGDRSSRSDSGDEKCALSLNRLECHITSLRTSRSQYYRARHTELQIINSTEKRKLPSVLCNAFNFIR